MNIFAVNGVAKSGKDTFCNMVCKLAVKERKSVQIISTIDPIKKIYKNQFGWDGDKSQDHHRKNLNSLKMIWKSCSNGPHNWTTDTLIGMEEEDVHSVFVMVREFEEMMDIVEIGMKHFKNCQTIQLIRLGLPIPPVEREFLNSHPDDYEYDWSIHNPTTVDPGIPLLHNAASTFWFLTSEANLLIKQKLNFNYSPMKYKNSSMSIRDMIFEYENK